MGFGGVLWVLSAAGGRKCHAVGAKNAGGIPQSAALTAPFRQGGQTPQSRQSRDNSPCQGEPLLGTGDADCHTSDVGHWLAMTGCKKRGANPGGAM